MTEFGRTARINGTEGTDHGTATVALLAGGALKGGRVIADWPGLKSTDLYENRDLKPTTDLRAVLKGLLKDHLRADERVLAENVFPGKRRRQTDDGAGGLVCLPCAPLRSATRITYSARGHKRRAPLPSSSPTTSDAGTRCA